MTDTLHNSPPNPEQGAAGEQLFYVGFAASISKVTTGSSGSSPELDAVALDACSVIGT